MADPGGTFTSFLVSSAPPAPVAVAAPPSPQTQVLLYDPVSYAQIIFPITPAQIKATSAAVIYRFSESRKGGFSRPHGRQEAEYTFSCRLPGLAQSTLPHVHDWQPPANIIAQLDTWANSTDVAKRTKLILNVPAKGITQDVYLGDYSYTWAGAFGDAVVDVHLIEFRSLTVDLASTNPVSAPDQSQSAPTQPDDPPVPGSYTVQDGDTLWLIAKQQMGDGGLWQQLYQANADTIGPSPNVITPGMVLQIPGGQADTATPDATPSST